MKVDAIFRRLKFNNMRTLPRRRHLSRINNMALAIEERFPEVRTPEQIRLKHIQWLLSHWFSEQSYAPSTIRDYRDSLGLLVDALGRGADWRGRLGLTPAGPGGRPRTLTVVRSAKYFP